MKITKEHLIGFSIAMLFVGIAIAPIIKTHQSCQQLRDAKLNQVIYGVTK